MLKGILVSLMLGALFLLFPKLLTFIQTFRPVKKVSRSSTKRVKYAR